MATNGQMSKAHARQHHNNVKKYERARIRCEERKVRRMTLNRNNGKWPEGLSRGAAAIKCEDIRAADRKRSEADWRARRASISAMRRKAAV